MYITHCRVQWLCAGLGAGSWSGKSLQAGKLEAEAVSQLQTNIPKHVVDNLANAVRIRGLTKLITHELIAKEVFSSNWSSGIGQLESWKEELRNDPDHKLVT